MSIENLGFSWESLATVHQSFYDNLKQLVGKDTLSLYENNQKLAIALGSSVCALATYYALRKKNDGLKDIPGPPTVPFFGNYLSVRGKRKHLVYEEIAKQYGKICKVKLFNIDIVIVSSLEAIQELLVEKSLIFAGRPETYRLQVSI